MKKLNESEMKKMFGGQSFRDCRDVLQNEAFEWSKTEHTIEESNAFYDDWSNRWDDCLRSLDLI